MLPLAGRVLVHGREPKSFTERMTVDTNDGEVIGYSDSEFSSRCHHSDGNLVRSCDRLPWGEWGSLRAFMALL
jgi:hypothetical protein